MDTVERATDFLKRFEVVVIKFLRALKHHVLEQVSEAGLARLFVLRADVVPDVNGDDRRRVILVQDHPQAI